MLSALLVALAFSPAAHADETGPYGVILAFAHVGGAAALGAPAFGFGENLRDRPTAGVVQSHLIGIQLDPLALDSRTSIGGYGAQRIGWEGRSAMVVKNESWSFDNTAFLLLSATPLDAPVTVEGMLGAHLRPELSWDGGGTAPAGATRWGVTAGPSAGARLGLHPSRHVTLALEGVSRPLSGGGDLGATLHLFPTPVPKEDENAGVASVDLGYSWLAEEHSHRLFIGFTMRAYAKD